MQKRLLIMLGALLATLLFTAPALAAAYHTIIIGGDLSDWDTDEMMETDNGRDLYITWNETNLYIGLDLAPGEYLSDDSGAKSFFVAIDTDLIHGSGAGSDGYARVNFTGSNRPEIFYAFAGSGGWYEWASWNGTSWDWQGWSDAGTYYDWSGNTASMPGNELTIPLANLGNPDAIAVFAWVTPEQESNIDSSWPTSNPTGSSPNFAHAYHFPMLIDGPAPDRSVLADHVIINEVNVYSYEWVELYNPTDTAVDIGDWYLDADISSFAHTIPSGTMLAPGGYYSYTRSSTTSTLDNGGEVLNLYDDTAALIDQVGYGSRGGAPAPCAEVPVVARVPNGTDTDDDARDWNLTRSPTKGAANDVPPVLLGSSLIINEVYPSPISGNDHVEIYNPTGDTYTLTNWILSDGDNIDVLDVGGTITVTAGGWIDLEENVNWAAGMELANYDVIYLFDPDGVRVDQVAYSGGPSIGGTESAQRIPDGAGPNDGYLWDSSGGGVTLFVMPTTLGYTNVPSLEITKDAAPSAGVLPGDRVTYTVVLHNPAPIDATGIIVTDTLPTEVDFAGWIDQPTGASESSGEITWSGTVSASTSITFTFVVTNNAIVGAVENTAEFAHTTGSGSDSATFNILAGADLSVEKTVDPESDLPLDGSGVVTYTILVANTGNELASGVVLTDILPSEVDFAGWIISETNTLVAADVITWAGDIDAFTTLTWTFTADVGTGTSLATVVNTATVTFDGEDIEDSAEFEFEFVTPYIIINEFDAQTPGTDIEEFVELYDGGAGNTALDELVLVFFNGDATDDASYRAIDLDGYSTDADGYFVAGNTAVPGVDVIFPSNGIQNGVDAIGLYVGSAADFLSGTPVTTTGLIDAVVYDDFPGGGDDTVLRAILLNPGQPLVLEGSNANYDSAQRCPNGSGGERNTDTYAAFPPSPGEKNCYIADLSLTKSIAPTNNPDVGDTITYTLELVNSAGSPLSATNVVVVDYLPSTTTAITYVNNSCGATVVGNVLTWTIPTILPDEVLTCDIVIQADADGINLVNYAEVAASDQDDPDSTPGNLGAYVAEDDEAVVWLTVGTPADCGTAATLIHTIQGSGSASAFTDTHTIEGVVVGDFQDTETGLSGFYVQEENDDADADTATSEGIFVYDNAFGMDVIPGDLVRVTGEVGEYNNLTELKWISAITICGTSMSGEVTPVTITLPIADLSDWEQYEGMLVAFSQDLHVTENYELGRYGQPHLSVYDRLYNPTSVVTPGVDALALQDLNDRSRIILDDGDTTQNPDPVIYPAPGLSGLNTLRGGYTVSSLTGVMDQYWSDYRVQPVGTIDFVASNPRTVAPDDVGGRLRVASFNVLNYFNGDGLGGGFPTSRGANSFEEFTRQRTKIITAVLSIDADVIGLMEIENDGYVATSAIADLVSGLNAIAGAGVYTYVNPGVAQIGDDEIAVGLIYKPGSVTPVGAAAILDDTFDPDYRDDYNRPALAQTFEENSTGERFTAVVNHLKSKGSACDAIGDPDTGDGQGNCNLTRTTAMTVELAWLSTDPTGSGDPDFLIIGDLNSYAQEDPIVAAEDAGYINLVDAFVGAHAYSYVFDGQAGYLDHGLATPYLASQVVSATIWHINADEPIALDYNVEYKSADQVDSFYDPGPYRASDHDPVVIGLDLASPDLSGSTKASSASGAVMSEDIVTYTITLSNSGSINATTTVTDILGSYYTVYDAMDFTESPLNTLVWTGVVTAGETVELQFVAQVEAVADLPIGVVNLANTAWVYDGAGTIAQVTDPAPPSVTVHTLYLPIILHD
ncbi:MAG: ExeM/NucH family extracellular endonuclease [Anaerolineae bacterium]|nr:ExeM/NucH family extracellular endonuclease [Anaerolineae bacterium]